MVLVLSIDELLAIQSALTMDGSHQELKDKLWNQAREQWVTNEARNKEEEGGRREWERLLTKALHTGIQS